jgi:hypothetical protein
MTSQYQFSSPSTPRQGTYECFTYDFASYFLFGLTEDCASVKFKIEERPEFLCLAGLKHAEGHQEAAEGHVSYG